MEGIIYKIENLVNGKVYIGQTSKSFKRRIQSHLAKLRGNYHNNTHLQSSFRKYGEDNFKSEILEICPLNELDDREIYWIYFYKEIKCCYNFEDGGNLKKIISIETRDKLSKASKRMWSNEDTREKITKRLKRGKGNYNSRSVICVNDMKIFNTMTEAGEYYDIRMTAIQQTISGRNPYCKSKDGKTKLEFQIYEEGKIYKPKNHMHKQAINVVCVTTNEIFGSIREAANKYNLETTNISKVCKGKQNSTGKLPDGTKLKWQYYSDYIKNTSTICNNDNVEVI